MVKMRRPTIIATILFVGTVTLVAGTVAALALPMSGSAGTQASRAQAAAAPAASTDPKTTARDDVSSSPTAVPAPAQPSPAATPKSADAAITYTVQRGDTLIDIAAWFKQHGYQKLYAANRSVIGSNPNLIRPGQRIIIRSGKMTVQDPK